LEQEAEREMEKMLKEMNLETETSVGLVPEKKKVDNNNTTKQANQYRRFQKVKY
jgi:hypothetical protein